jgi:hypothetical protein
LIIRIYIVNVQFSNLIRRSFSLKKKSIPQSMIYIYIFFRLFVGRRKFVYFLFYFCFNTTFSNISAISWRPVLVVEAGLPGGNHRPWASNWFVVNVREKKIVNWIFFFSFSFQFHSIHIFFRTLMFKTPFPPRVPIVISAYLADVQIKLLLCN